MRKNQERSIIKFLVSSKKIINMQNIQHFVITRFNLKISGGFTTDKSGVATRSDDWLNHRFDLFEQYCLPSLGGQTNKDFTWLLFFDEETPNEYKSRIESALKICPQIQVCYIKGINILPVLNSYITDDTDVLITTRIDNDDAFREDALEVIRGQVNKTSKKLCINLRFGYSYDGDQAEVFSQKYNPFSSLIEYKSDSDFVTIFGVGHGKIHHLAKVKQIKTGPHWLMVVHDRNVANRMPDEYRSYGVWKFKRFKRYVKKYLVHKVRRLFWSSDFKKKYKLYEINDKFHINAN